MNASAALLDTFFAANPHFNPADFDPNDQGALDQLDWGDASQVEVTATLLAYRSFARIGVSDTLSRHLLGADVHSALHIAQLPRQEFMRMAKEHGNAEADKVAYDRALGVKNRLLLKVLSQWQEAEPNINAGAFHEASSFSQSQAESIMEALQIENGCACRECVSVFSPAAYYTDLKKLIADYINTAEVPDELSLGKRRPDLATLDLSCESTNHIIPHLEVANDLLERKVATPEKGAWHTLSTAVYPFNLPAHHHQVQSETYLSHLKTSRAQLYRTFAEAPVRATLAQEYLQLSEAEVALITGTTEGVQLEEFYGFAKDTPDWISTVSKVSEFLYHTGLNRNQLDALLTQNLHPEEIKGGFAKRFFINSPSSEERYIAIIEEKLWLVGQGFEPIPLTPEHLDRLHRFIRLAQRLRWSFADLDLVLRSSCGNKLEASALPIIAGIQSLQQTLNIPIANLCSGWAAMNSLGKGKGPEFKLTDPFNSTFNNALAASSSLYILPEPEQKALYETLFGKGLKQMEPNDPLVNSRLLAALGIKQEELDLIIHFQGVKVGKLLDPAHLSLLHRYVQLARWIKLSIADLLLLLHLVKIDSNLGAYNPFGLSVPFDSPTTIDPKAILQGQKVEETLWLVQLLVGISAWMRSHKMPVTALAALCSDQHRLPLLKPEQLRELFQNLQRKFSQVLLRPHHFESATVSPAEAEAIFKELIENGQVDAKGLGVVLTIGPAAPDIGRVLQQQQTRQLETVHKVLATGLSVSELHIQHLVRAGFSTTDTEEPLLVTVMLAIMTAEEITPDIGDDAFKRFFAILQTTAHVTQRFRLSADDLTELTEKPQFFQMDPENPIAKLSLSNLKTLSDHKWLTKPLTEHIRGPLALKRRNDLALQLGKTREAILEKVWAPLWGENPSWEKEKTVEETLFALLKAKAPEAERPTLAANLDHADQVWRRDRSMPYNIHALQSNPTLKYIRSARDLYEYFLLDVEMGPEADTSRVENAISTLQLYVHRCRMHLEEGVKLVEPELLSQKWAWMEHYRVWEANRRVVLFPENYLHPDLRRERSPLFETLSQALKQSDTTDENIETAFNGYMDELAIVANLRIAGSYVYDDPEPGSKDKILVLLGRSATIPVKTYFRTARFIGTTTSAQWEPWEEISLHTDSEQLFPVYAFGKLFVFWVEVKVHKQPTTRDETKPPHYKAEIFYTFQNANGHWHQAQVMSEVELGKYPSENLPSAWRELYIVSGERKEKAVYILYGKRNLNNDREEVDFSFRLTSDLEIETLGRATVPALWLGQPMPKVGEDAVVDKSIQHPDASIANQPDWSVFAAEDGCFLIRPNHFRESIGRSVELKGSPRIRQVAELDLSIGQQLCSEENVFYPDAFTIVFWFRKKNHKNGEVITCVTDNGQAIYKLFFYDKYLAFETPGGGALRVEYGLFNDEWHHLAVAFHGSQSIQVWVDGQRSSAKLSGGTNAPRTRLLIGKNTKAPRTELEFEIYELSFWDKLLPTSDVDHLRTTAPSLRAANLVSYWPLNSTTVDHARGERHLTPAPQANWAYLRDGALVIDSAVDYSSQYTQNPGFDIHRLTSNAVPKIAQKLHTGGVPALLDTKTQRTPELPAFGSGVGEIGYNPNYVRRIPESKHLGFEDAEGLYYKELFFHAPWLLAHQLSSGQQFQDAQKWYHHVYDPTIKEDASRQEYRWRYLPFQPDYQDTTAGLLRNVTWVDGGPLAKVKTPYFNGKNASIDADHRIELSEQDFTIELWAKLEKDSRDGDYKGEYPRYYLFSHGQKKIYEGLAVFIDQGDNKHPVVFSLYGNDVTTTNTDLDENWHHWAFVYKKASSGNVSEVVIYMDGDRMTPTNELVDVPYQGVGEFIIGNVNWHKGCNFHGQLAEVRVWKYARNASEVKGAFERRLNSNEINDPRLIRYWPLDHTENTWVPNLAGKGWKAAGNEAAKLNLFASDPFDPFHVADLRPIAYKKAVAMHYIDNLTNQGDALFRLYTRESIAEATMYYVMAANLLGKRPAPKPHCPAPKTSEAANASTLAVLGRMEMEQVADWVELPGHIADHPALSLLDHRFCLPENDYFNAYWDRVEDRLYKIRHGLNIDGMKEALPLFDLQLDPESLLRAAAGGSHTGIALSTAQVPHYRFSVILAKAREFTSQVGQLGNALLSALEKRDAEALTLLHTTHERNILELTTQLKQDQLAEATQNALSVVESKKNAELRAHHYEALHNEYLSPLEEAQLGTMITAHVLSSVASLVKLSAIGGHMVPQVEIPGTWGTNVSFGGLQIGGALDSTAGQIDLLASQFSFASNLSATLGSFQRRDEEWTLQQRLAEGDVRQLDKQIAASDFRQQMAKREVNIHAKTREHNEEIQAFLQQKFTNGELYQWMVAKLSGLYFHSFQMAHDLALMAERAFQYELLNEERFITSIYWDSLKQGLLSGEALQLDLNRMEKAWLDKNKRRMEIDRTVSLMQHDPMALLHLKTKGSCEFHLTEALFSRDFPGHYGRQIKSISLSFPAVVGPYQNFNATLTQTVSRTLIQPDKAGFDYLHGAQKEVNGSVRQNPRQHEQIALSRGLNDSGIFELNFHDERYLPFEGTGAVSSWKLELSDNRSIDPASITDVIIHVQYTALNGNSDFKSHVMDELSKQKVTEGTLFNLNREVPEKWESFLDPSAEDRSIAFHVAGDRFKSPQASELCGIYVLLDLTEAGKEALKNAKLTVSINEQQAAIVLQNGMLLHELNPAWGSFTDTTWTLEPAEDQRQVWTKTNVRNAFILGLYRGVSAKENA